MADLSGAYELRAWLRRYALSPRVRDCGRRAICAAPAVRVEEDEQGNRSAWWTGVLRCGRQHSCPVCAAKKAAERASELTDMMRADSAGPGWRMLTLTFSHQRGEALAELLDRMTKAFRAWRSTRAVRELFDRRVSATARAIEVTWSDRNGWHPHIHLLVRSERWTEDEQWTAEKEWIGRIRSLAGVALRWSDCGATYLAKLGAEAAGIGKKAKRDHLNAWQLAVALVQAEPRTHHKKMLVARWREYQTAMKGRRVLELDERAKQLAEKGARERKPPRQVWVVPLYSEAYAELARFESDEPAILWLAIESVTGTGCDPPHELTVLVDDILASVSERRRQRRKADARPLSTRQ